MRNPFALFDLCTTYTAMLCDSISKLSNRQLCDSTSIFHNDLVAGWALTQTSTMARLSVAAEIAATSASCAAFASLARCLLSGPSRSDGAPASEAELGLTWPCVDEKQSISCQTELLYISKVILPTEGNHHIARKSFGCISHAIICMLAL